MTENNIFQEIQEDLDRQRMAALWTRYGIWVIVAALAIVLATAGYTAWQSWHTGRDQKATAALVNLLDPAKSDESKQVEALIDYAHKNNTLFQATLARLRAAEIALEQGHTSKAIEIYDDIAQDTKADSAFRQLADLKSVELQLATDNPDMLSKRLDVLSQENAPWHYTANEYRGYLALRTGDKAKAHDIFTALSQDAGVPETQGHRARDLANYLSE